MNRKHQIINTVLIVVCLSVLSVLLLKKESDKSAFFLSAEVYNEFDYKKELELELNKMESGLTQTLDSLEKDLQFTVNYLNSIEPTQEQIFIYQNQENNYFKYKQEQELNYSKKMEEYYTLIWDRINGYVQEYGEENGYQFIFGANGDGSIMYAQEDGDITSEIISYINSKYAGE